MEKKKSHKTIYKVNREKIQPLLIQWEWFVWYRCYLTANKSGLECTRVNNDDFTGPVSGAGKRRWVSMCTVWLSHSKWLNELKFCVKLEHSSMETICMIQKAAAVGNRRLAASSQYACLCITSHAEFFCETANHPRDSALLQPRFGTLQLLAFPKTKITFERE